MSTRKGGGFYGYKLHLAVCSRSGLPLAWKVATGRDSDQAHAAPLLDSLAAHGFAPETCAMDSGYDQGHVYDACEARDVRPVIKLRKTTRVLRGEHKPPTCEHGTWTFAGSDSKRGASKWRCPTGECKPASRWVKADRLHPLVPRETARWGSSTRGDRRSSGSRSAQERMGAFASPGARYGAGRTAR